MPLFGVVTSPLDTAVQPGGMTVLAVEVVRRPLQRGAPKGLRVGERPQRPAPVSFGRGDRSSGVPLSSPPRELMPMHHTPSWWAAGCTLEILTRQLHAWCWHSEVIIRISRADRAERSGLRGQCGSPVSESEGE
jgi:hypothetical protein